jgi:NTE family protein
MILIRQHGIYIDMLARTGAGALTGTLYAAGLDPDYVLDCFKTDLQPAWFFRQLPCGGCCQALVARSRTC